MPRLALTILTAVMLATTVATPQTAFADWYQVFKPWGKIRQLSCSTQQEWTGDEPYLQVNGVMVWHANQDSICSNTLDGGGCSHVSLNHYNLTYLMPYTLELWEDDGDSWFDGNDFMGSHSITSTLIQSGSWLKFVGSGAWYDIYVERVSPILI